MIERIDVEGKGVFSRDIVHAKGLLHRAVMILVFDGKDGIFVQQRSFLKDVFPGLYEASCSGHVRHGEKDIDAAVRELKEELSLRVKKSSLKKLLSTTVHELPEYEMITVYELTTKEHIRTRKEVNIGTFLPIGMLLAMEYEKIFTPVFASLLPRLRPLLEQRQKPSPGPGTPATPRRRPRASA